MISAATPTGSGISMSHSDDGRGAHEATVEHARRTREVAQPVDRATDLATARDPDRLAHLTRDQLARITLAGLQRIGERVQRDRAIGGSEIGPDAATRRPRAPPEPRRRRPSASLAGAVATVSPFIGFVLSNVGADDVDPRPPT